MRKLSFLVLLSLLVATNICIAQNGIITHFAGNGSSGWTGDGSTATAAEIGTPYGVTFDVSGNMYIVDISNSVIRKVDATGIITTIAGNGTQGYSGDLGPATAANIDGANIAIDASGNIYIADWDNNVVRKVNTSGIITTIAGSGYLGYSGDGGPATAATMSKVLGVAVDAAGNLYACDYGNHVIRKINASGIITTIAGNGTAGFSGDGGPATAAQLSDPRGITLDVLGNIYFTDEINCRIREINTSGIISTVVGTGISGFSGDGGLAVNAQIGPGFYLAVSNIGNIYFADPYNYRVRKVTGGIISTIAGNGASACSGIGGPALNASFQPIGVCIDQAENMYIADDICYDVYKMQSVPTVVADSFSVYIDNLCNGVNITAVANSSSSLNFKIFFGDNSSSITPFSPATSGQQVANTAHSYTIPGVYMIKMVLLNGTTPIDSATYSYNCLLCNTRPVTFYYDANGDCTKDSTDPLNYLPVTTEVDSNGVAVDTISATSGFDYTAYGNPGDIYIFKILSTPAGMYASCLSAGVISDTLQIGEYNTATKNIALSCSSATGFDLAVYAGTQSGRHLFSGDIIVNNVYCTSTPATLTAQLDPKYSFTSSFPLPTSVAGNTVTWAFADIAATTPQPYIHFTCEVPGAWLIPGDTIHSNYIVTPIVGDINPGNNTCNTTDTVKISYDPNEMFVSPSGTILSGTTLQYTINFENTGNDTAFNIYVMDTLSPYVIPSSLKILAASAPMNTIPIKAGGNNIVKFDFPGINLLDSAYHDQCNGMLTFNINTKTGLPNGTTIFNHAGIFFDDNPVVMTDTVENIIGFPSNVAMLNNTNNIQIYPNPTTGELNITMDKDDYNSFSITNTMGQLLLQQPLSTTQSTVNLQMLPPGLYYITVKGDNGSKVQKFVKM